MSKLTAALSWAARGFRVFPLQENSKLPKFEQFYDVASTDTATITAWWQDPLTGIERDYNVGVDTSRLLVIDLDNKDGKAGQANYEAIGGRFDTLTVRTPTGGYHLYYDPAGAAYANSQGDNGVAPGVDTRGWHGYVLAPGSTIDDRAYELMFDAELARVPGVVLPKLRAPEARAERAASAELDTPSAIATARAFLDTRTAAYQGMGGDDHTFRTICEVRDRGVSEATALELLLEDWNERCEPPWPVLELQAKVQNAYAYAQRGEGEKSPEAYFGGVNLIEPERAPATHLDAIGDDDAFGNVLPEETVQPRPWLLEGLLLRRAVSALIAPGSAGKSLAALTLAVHLAHGDAVVWGRVNRFAGQPVRSIVYDAEDDLGEMSVRVHGICRALGYDPRAVTPHIFLWSGRGSGMAKRFKVAIGDPPAIQEEHVKSLVAFAVRKDVQFIALVPLGKLHDANENDNGAMGYVMDCFGLVAEQSGAAVMIAHHTAKPNGAMSESHAGNANAGAGAKRIVDTSRAAFTLETMGQNDAIRYGIGAADRFRYVRLDDAKHNYTLQGGRPTWLYKETVKLLNGDLVGSLKETNMDERADITKQRAAAIILHAIQRGGGSSVSVKDAADALRAEDELFRAMTATQLKAEVENWFREVFQAGEAAIKIDMVSGTKSVVMQ